MKKLLMAMFALALLTACSSEAPQTGRDRQAAAQGARPSGGPERHSEALYLGPRMGSDARPYRVESTPNPDSQGRDGKSAIWRAAFASVSKRGTKPYTWSGSEGSERGVNPGLEDTYNPSNSSTQAFDMAFLKIDSDKAFEVAQQHGGDKILAKAADAPVLYILEWDRVNNELIWHVIYGTSRGDAS